MSDLHDNLYPRNGEYFALTEPVDQADKRKADENEFYSELPLIKEIIDRFKERIIFYDSVSAIPDEVKANPEQFMHVVSANAVAKQILISEKNYLENLIKEHVK